MPYLTMPDGESLFVRDMGQGPLVLLVHGFAMDSRHWLPAILPHIRRYRFLMPDLRGFGRSRHLTCTDRCVLTSHSRDLQAILDHYRADSVYLGGISLGALTGLRFLELFDQERVRHYLHIDQGPKIINDGDWRWGLFGEEGEERLARWYAMLDDFSGISPETPFESIPSDYRDYFFREFARFAASAMSKEWLKKGVAGLLRSRTLARQILPMENWYTLLQHVDAYINPGYDMLPILHRLDVPCTLMIGRKSDMYPWQGQIKMAEALPDARVAMMENSGHIPFLDEPIRFQKVLREAFN